jgi:hypothetical protein
MGNKHRKMKNKAAAAVLHKTGGVPPVTLAVADPLRAFTETVPIGSTSQISLIRAMQRILKDVRVNRPQKGPLKNVKLHPKRALMERLTLRREGALLILGVLPGDPIATLDGKPYVRPEAVDAQREGEIALEK